MLRAQWLEHIRDVFKADKDELRPTIDDVYKAIDLMGPSSCGPDGMPVELYKIMKGRAR